MFSMDDRPTYIIYTRRSSPSPSEADAPTASGYKKTFLSGVKYSELEEAITDRYSIHKAGSDIYADKDYEGVMGAFEAMEIVEMDGRAVPLKDLHPSLFVGSIGAAYNPDELLLRHGITHTISLTRLSEPKFPEFIQSLTVPHVISTDPATILRDHPDLVASIHDIFVKKGRAKNKVLIHGWRDKTRSVAVAAAAAYVMKYHGLNCPSALELVPESILGSTRVRCGS